MATNAGEIIIRILADAQKLKDEIDGAKSSISSFASSAGDFMKGFGQVLASVGAAAVAFGIKSVQAYGEQETAIAALNQALANQGKFSVKTTQDLQAYATQLQKITTFGDEVIISTQAQLTSFGLEGEQLKKVTKATLDLATAKGIDLNSAAQLLGKAFVGETGTLSKYGIIIDESIPKSEKFAAVMKAMGQFTGAAEAEAITFSGQIKQLGNAFSDLQEEIGAMIAGEGQSVVSLFKDIIEKITDSVIVIKLATQEWGGFANTLKIVLLEALRSVIQATLDYINHMTILGPILKLIGVDINSMKLALDTQTNSWQASGQAAAAAAASAKQAELGKRGEVSKTDALIKRSNEVRNTQADEMLAKATARKEQLAQMEADIDNAILEAHQNNLAIQANAIEEFFGVQDASWKSFGDMVGNIVQATFDNFGKAMADVLIDSKNFSEALKGVWKSLVKSLISEIIALIVKLIIAVALKSALGIGGGSAGVVAGTIASLKSITTKPDGKSATGGIINEPSIVTGLRSGKRILAGESGAEAIVPMGGGNKTASEMGMDFSGGGGGGITINISGQFLEGNESSWNKLFRQKILPEIKRNTMTNPTGNFIRRRGATS